MDFRFYKAPPEAPLEWPQHPMDAEPDFVLVALERTNDPDANNHTGFDFFGAYGDGALIDAWAAEQVLEGVAKDDLPNSITFYPSPFDEA